MNELLQKIEEQAEKQFLKKFEIESEPANYIHEGLEPAQQFSHLKAFLRQACTHYARSVLEKLEVEDIEGPHSYNYNLANAQWREAKKKILEEIL